MSHLVEKQLLIYFERTNPTMIIDSLDAVFYTAMFILPGFIINSIIDATNPPKKHNDGIFFLKCLLYSIISCACLSWLYIIVMNNIEHEVAYWLLLLAITVVGSTTIALVIAIIKQKQIIFILMNKLGIRTIHPTQSAWDYVFSLQKSNYVIVTLIDDTQIKGLYSSESFSASDSEERDLFLEKLYYKVDNEEWVLDEDSDGIYISKEQIKYIEFKK